MDRQAIYLCGYRDGYALDRGARAIWRDLQTRVPRQFLADYARGFAAAKVARLFGVDLSGDAA